MTKNQERIEKTCNTVETILRETYTIYSKKVDQMISDSAFYEMLKKDPYLLDIVEQNIGQLKSLKNLM
ncbi:hypothetical protein L2089_15905 [Paenibacillus hunanensis]|uniref:hypothetical protein n=1 Tax=Paenibacillus hunanensis TaxID=539262 RepID=UPI002026F4ED|nr:hypothetical protein [Paenibacillus hunanensis]MCL9662179.1 hypothetical protein [Paenibacillus hunanensis]